MRIPGRPRGDRVTIRVDGRAVAAYCGETLFAALTAAGIRVLRHASTKGETCAPDRPGGPKRESVRGRLPGEAASRQGAAPTEQVSTSLGPHTETARGGFCGMGVCQECRVTVDGRPGQRACMTEVREGMEVETDAP